MASWINTALSTAILMLLGGISLALLHPEPIHSSSKRVLLLPIESLDRLSESCLDVVELEGTTDILCVKTSLPRQTDWRPDIRHCTDNLWECIDAETDANPRSDRGAGDAGHKADHMDRNARRKAPLRQDI